MASNSRKRVRDSSILEPSADISIRESLISRASQCPRLWRRPESATVDAGIDGFLCALGRSVTEALQSLADSAESSRAQLREMRAAVHAAVDSQFDETEHDIAAAETSKSAALERELISVDASLDRWRSDHRSFHEDVAALSDTELKTQHATLSSRLDAMEAALVLLPNSVVEPPIVGLTTSASDVLAAITGCVRVIAPLPITAADVTLPGSPGTIHVQPGDTVQLRLSLSARHAPQSDDEVTASLGRLSGAVVVEVSLEASGGGLQSLASTLSFDAALRSVLVSVVIPESAPAGYYATIRAVSIMGHRIGDFPFPAFPCRVQLHRGIRAPLHLEAESVSLCITPDGQLFAPPSNDLDDDVLIFDANGGYLQALSLDALGMRRELTWAAYAFGDSPSLLLAESHIDSCRFAALNMSTREVRWSLEPADLLKCGGITVLPTHGIAVLSSVDNNSLLVHRLSDGARTGTLIGKEPENVSTYLAADSPAGVVYGVCTEDSRFSVHAWSCVAESVGAQISSIGRVAAAGTEGRPRPLAVVPPTRGKTTSHLVIGTVSSSELRVLSLPDLALVHTHRLEGMRVMGLAADPWGAALAVCSSSGEIHVLTWPLPGMPPLV